MKREEQNVQGQELTLNTLNIGRVAVLLLTAVALGCQRAPENTYWDPRSTEELRERLESRDRKVRGAALGWLGFSSSISNDVQAVMPTLVKLLRDRDPHIRGGVISCMVECPAEAKPAVPALLKIATDPKEFGNIRYMAIDLLREIGAEPKLIVPTLIELLSVRHRNPRPETSPDSAPNPGPDDLRTSAAESLRYLGAAAKAAAPALIEIVTNRKETVEMRSYAVGALKAISPDAKDAVPALVVALGSENWGLRRTAALALHDLGSEARGAVPALIAAMKDTKLDVRRAAIYALEGIGPDAKAAIQPLQELLADKAIGWAAKDALRKIAPGTIKP